LTTREIVLSGATIRNGRIYFSSADIKFFPPDSFADREATGHKGKAVVFRAGGGELETDIRMSSGQRISPRKSFAAFLRQVAAKEGSRLRIVRVADREYTVEYLA